MHGRLLESYFSRKAIWRWILSILPLPLSFFLAQVRLQHLVRRPESFWLDFLAQVRLQHLVRRPESFRLECSPAFDMRWWTSDDRRWTSGLWQRNLTSKSLTSDDDRSRPIAQHLDEHHATPSVLWCWPCELAGSRPVLVLHLFVRGMSS